MVRKGTGIVRRSGKKGIWIDTFPSVRRTAIFWNFIETSTRNPYSLSIESLLKLAPDLMSLNNPTSATGTSDPH